MSDIVKPTEAPKIEFPCAYPIRVMGQAEEKFLSTIIEITELHAKVLNKEDIPLRDSSKGRFVSAQLVIHATGVEQLERLHLALRQYPAVKMVL